MVHPIDPFPTITLPRHIQSIIHRFDNAGYEVYCVGGCVRDLLRGVVPHDWDMCTSARPEEVLALFPDIPCKETGIRFGTVTVLWDHNPVEITTYRQDVAYDDHRRPRTVSFSATLLDDCRRRDFTVNAIAYHPDRGIVDYFDGMGDLQSKTLRCVGDPNQRFSEDALRILRALRFSSTLGFTVEEETASALRDCAPQLSYVSKERIHSEFQKLLCGQSAAVILSAFLDVISVFLPISSSSVFEKEGRRAFYACDSYITRLFVFLYFCAAQEEYAWDSLLSALPFPSKTVEGIQRLRSLMQDPPPQERISMRYLLSRVSANDASDYLTVFHALHPEADTAFTTAYQLYRDVLAEGDVISVSALAVNGNDLQQIGLRGKQIGQMLLHLLSLVMEEKVPNHTDALLSIVITKNDKKG